MSLNIAFQSAKAGIALSEKKIAISSSNINNADRVGYTRKTLNNEFLFTGFVSLPTGGTAVQAVVNPLLQKQIVQQGTQAAAERTRSTYLTSYGNAFGSTAEESITLQSGVATMISTLQVLEANAGDIAAKSKVISTAQEVSSALSNLSQIVQNGRLRANNDIASSVTTVNQTLARIADLNRRISTNEATSQGTGDLQDERMVAIQQLSQEMGIQYFFDSGNQAMVYLNDGTPMVSGSYHSSLTYNAVGSVSSTTVYPGGFPAISMNGTDITNVIRSGKIGALVELRDTTLPGEQEKLDVFANGLKTTVNRVLNQGAAYQPLSQLTGTEPVTLATAFVGTGNLRVAVTDATGVVTNVTDIDLTTLAPATVAGLITALNGIAGVTAAINPNGYLDVSASSGTGRISMNPMNSAVGTQSATEFFGFNNLFTNPGTGAGTIRVNSNLIANYEALAVGSLNSGVGLAAGDYGVTSGDTSTIRNLVDTMNMAQNFAAAGNFNARTSSLLNYAGAVIADVATQATAAKQKASTSEASYIYLQTSFANEAGVNIDEETANLTALQTVYQANAQVISTVRTLFQSLLDAVR